MQFYSPMLQHLYDCGASLDRQGIFLMYIGPKCAGTSVRKKALKDRILMKKYHGDAYAEAFSSLTEVEVMSMFRFTLVRNPFDRVLSAYLYLRHLSHHSVPQKDFTSFVRDNLAVNGPSIDEHFVRLHDKLMVGGQLIFNFVGKLENIQEDWVSISDAIGCSSILPEANVTKRKTKDYKLYYDSKSREVVARIYQRELEDFDYDF